jgi:hypothetical protein
LAPGCSASCFARAHASFGAPIEPRFGLIFRLLSEEYALHGLPGAVVYAARAYGDILASGVRERATDLARYRPRGPLAAQTPFFTGVVVGALAIAIAANAAAFSVLDGVLLKPLPFSSRSSR